MDAFYTSYGEASLRHITIVISLVAAVAFLALSILTAFQIFNLATSADGTIRGELWLLLVMTFIGGGTMIGVAWGISELTEARREHRELMRHEEPAHE